MSGRTHGLMVVSVCVWVNFWHKTGLLQMLLEVEKESRAGKREKVLVNIGLLFFLLFLFTLRHLTTYQASHWLPLTSFPPHITYSFLSKLFSNTLQFFPLKSNKSSNFIISKTKKIQRENEKALGILLPRYNQYMCILSSCSHYFYEIRIIEHSECTDFFKEHL